MAPGRKWPLNPKAASGGYCDRRGLCEAGEIEPFVYLDKNFIRMFAGIPEVVGRAYSMNGRVVSVQIRGETGPISEEAVLACQAGPAC